MDLSRPGALTAYSWRWFEVRLFGMSSESRTWRRLLVPVESRPAESSIDDLDKDLGISRE